MNTDGFLDIRQEGLPIGTKLLPKNMEIRNLLYPYGVVTVNTRMYRKWQNGAFVEGDYDDYEEWYLKNILNRDDKYCHDKEKDIYVLKESKYKFYGYAFGCEFYVNSKIKGIYKILLRIYWDNVKLYIKEGKEVGEIG